MKLSDYPAIYKSADGASANRQRIYFRSLVFQYTLLVIASALTMSAPLLGEKPSSALYLIVILLAAATALYTALKQPEKEWYQARAMAESVKTLTWRFVMCTEPFGADLKGTQADVRFRTLVSELIEINKLGAATLAYDMQHGEQITDQMRKTRNLDSDLKKDIYLKERVQNQFNWYSGKARRNRLLSVIFTYSIIAIYVISIGIGFAQYENIFSNNLWLSEPLLVVAASLIGWMQAKRFSELSASYNLAAHEIHRIKDELFNLGESEDYLAFVMEAEAAFSREHTQWTARQISNF